MSLLQWLTRPSSHDPEQERSEIRALRLIPSDGGRALEAGTLWLLSPLVRSLMASLSVSEDAVILLPDCHRDDVTVGLGLLRDSGQDTLVFNARVRSFLEAIGLDVRSSELWVKQEPQEGEELVAEETSDAEDDTEDAMETQEDISEDEREQVSYTLRRKCVRKLERLTGFRRVPLCQLRHKYIPRI